MEKREGWLRIITLNTWKGDGAYRKRLEEIGRQLRQLQPDILFLQEAVQSEDGSIDTAGFLAGFLRLHSIYAPARKKIRQIEDKEHVCHSGLAILAAYKITDERIDRLPSAPEDPDRISFTAEVVVNGKKILLTNLHLTYLPEADDLRLHQFAAVTKHINTITKPAIWLCGGDFNCVLDKHRLQEITRNSWFQIEDCYLAGGGNLPGKTLAGNNQPPALGRVDYILNLSGHGMSTPLCENGRIVLNKPDVSRNLPSDHFGVMVDIFIGKK